MKGLRFRAATGHDLPEIIGLLTDDKLGSAREKLTLPLPAKYVKAFAAISRDPNQELTVVEDGSGIIGTFQLSFIQYLTYQGGLRAQVEAVRVKSSTRGKGIGTKVFKHIIRHAKARGAHMLQLTSDKQRPEAIRFYESLGFVASHEGFKMHLKR